MPTIIKSENLDGVTAPSLPSGFQTSGTWLTSAIAPRSAPNCLLCSTTGAVSVWQSDTDDSASGDSDVSVWTKFGSSDLNGLSLVFLRGTATTTFSSKTCYEARIARDTGSTWSTFIFRRIAGTSALISPTLNISGFNLGEYYRLWCSATTVGGNVLLTLKIQRASDSQWLAIGGTWQASEVACFTITDSNAAKILGAGRGGVAVSQPSVASNAALDDFVFRSLAPDPATTATLSGPSSGLVNVASTSFTVSLDGSYTGTVTPATNGSGAFNPTSLTWSGTGESKTFTYTPSSTSGSPHSVSISASPSLTTSGSPIAYTVTASGAVTIDASNSALFWSPYNWKA